MKLGSRQRSFNRKPAGSVIVSMLASATTIGAFAFTPAIVAEARADESAAPAKTVATSDAGAPEARERLEGAKLDALLADVAKARKDVTTLRANFTQERTMTLLATTVKSTGELTFVAPERLRWELAAPDDVIYWVGPEGLSFRTRSSKATMPASSAPRAGSNVARGLADLRALLGGDLATLKERYTLGASRGPGDVEITGVAKDKSATVRGFTLILDKGLVLPRRARLLEGKTDTVDITFSNATVNVPIDPALMKP